MWKSIVGVALCVALLAGCQNNPFKKANPGDTGKDGYGVTAPVVAPDGLLMAPDQRFKDVPLPADLKIDINRTYVYESEALQIGRLVYYSSDDISELAQFFIRECPAANWKLTNILEASGAHLEFNKPGKRLTIEIKPQGPARKNLLIINLIPQEGAQ